MNTQERADLIASLKESLKDDANISFAFLFGSFKDYDDAVGFQDIDIAIYITGVSDVEDYALNVAVELSFKYNLSIECIPLNIAPVFFRYRIFKDGTVLFYRDENLMTNIREEAIRELE